MENDRTEMFNLAGSYPELVKKMSLVQNTTNNLFSTFMPRCKEISNRQNTIIYDLSVYPQDYFKKYNPANSFIKWAVVEVTDYKHVPEQMEQFILEGGKYAVFTHIGKSAGFEVFEYIFTQWLPNSDCYLDQRPHFEKLEGNKNKNESGSSELIYIPIRTKI